MDALLESLNEVATLLLPVVGVICLIFLAVLLYRIVIAVKLLPDTIKQINKALESVDGTVVSVNEIVDQLQEPVNTIVGVSKTVDKVNSAANGVVGTIASYAVKNSDVILNWSKDLFKKKNEDKSENEEEDFGIYE